MSHLSPSRRAVGPRLAPLACGIGLALALAACAGQSGPAPAAVATAPSPAPVAAPAPAPVVATTPAPAPAGPATGPDDGGAARAADPAAAAGRTAPDVATGTHGAVTSAERQATAVGLAILRKGGNAVDAAVAVGLALGVTHPTAGNIGGGGFMVVRQADGRTHAIDFREVAPGRASRDMYLDARGALTGDSRRGPRAAGIPGDIAGFAHAHARLGSLPWRDLVAPAIRLARDGVPLDAFHAGDLVWGTEAARKYLAELAARPKRQRALEAAVRDFIALLSKPDGSAYAAGELWRQPALAATLEAIARGGAAAFYRGPLAARLAAGVRKLGGLWTARDLARYKVVERTPISFSFRGNAIVTMPPPSAGGVTLRQILVASETLGLEKLPWDSVDRIHLYVEALRRIFADRSVILADPDFVDVPLATLLDPAYVVRRMGDIKRDRATPSSEVAGGALLVEKPQTTHYSVVDGGGMAVATTFTLNGGYGALVQIPGTGVTLNNEMDDFTAKVGAPNMFGLVQGPQNAIAPGKRMVSSMMPTIVSRDGKLRLVCGSPGGPTIVSTVAQVVLQVLDHGRPLDQAIAATRIHHQWMPDVVFHEADLPAATIDALRQRGHTLTSRGRIGHANCIEVDARTGALRAVADAGRDGGDADAY